MPSLPAVQVEQLYFYFINDVNEVSLVVDISEYHEVKRNALQAYRSQFAQAGSDQVATPLTNQYIERVKARDSLLGQNKGFAYAEGFAIKSPHAVQYF